ncbi:MAG: DUF6122 family protein [Mangrovibacterium sp.]
MQTIIHYSLHFIAPLIIARVFFPKNWKKCYILLLATMIIDIDHLLAEPIFQANRCSINFHPLHTYPALAVYIAMCFLKQPYRIFGIGLTLHWFTDLLDCVLSMRCFECALSI